MELLLLVPQSVSSVVLIKVKLLAMQYFLQHARRLAVLINFPLMRCLVVLQNILRAMAYDEPCRGMSPIYWQLQAALFVVMQFDQ